jgi:hypothetical protein
MKGSSVRPHVDIGTAIPKRVACEEGVLVEAHQSAEATAQCADFGSPCVQRTGTPTSRRPRREESRLAHTPVGGDGGPAWSAGRHSRLGVGRDRRGCGSARAMIAGGVWRSGAARAQAVFGITCPCLAFGRSSGAPELAGSSWARCVCGLFIWSTVAGLQLACVSVKWGICGGRFVGERGGWRVGYRGGPTTRTRSGGLRRLVWPPGKRGAHRLAGEELDRGGAPPA